VRAILTYHSIDDSGSVVSVSPADFERHVRFLVGAQAGTGAQVVSLEQVVAPAEASEDSRLALTFDDGFANFVDEAWPRLRDGGLRATLFVVTDRVGETNGWESGSGGVPVLPLADWDQLGRVAEEGCELGVHGRTHRALSDCSPAELEDEVAGAADELRRRTGRAASSFAYPYGAWDETSLAAVRAVFARACSTEMRFLEAGDDPRLLPRLDAYYLREEGRLESWGRPAFHRYVTWRALARRTRARLRSLLGGTSVRPVPRRAAR